MTDLSIRIAMAITVLVALVNAVVFYGGISVIWWLAGALPLGLLTIVAFWIGHALGDQHRGGLVCTLLLAALAWPMALMHAPALVGMALVVTAAPRGRMRPWIVLPANIGSVGIAAFALPWSYRSDTQSLLHAIALAHVVMLSIPITMFAYQRPESGP